MNKENTQLCIKDDQNQIRESQLPASDRGTNQDIPVGGVSKGNWRDRVKHFVVVKKMDED